MPGNRGQVGADLIIGQADDRAAPGGNGSGFSLQAMADLSASIGQLATEVKATRDRQQQLWQACRPIPGIPLPVIAAGTNILDMPELLAPRTGYWWDVKTVVAATFTAGSVNVYLGGSGAAPQDSQLALVFPSAGAYQMGTGQLLVPPGERLIFKTVGTTGNTTPWLTAIEVADWALPAYLL